MIGAAALLVDGIITPAVSVTSAIEGLGIIKGVEHVPVVPIEIAVISLFFFLQRFGTQSVGLAFGPMMMLTFIIFPYLSFSGKTSPAQF